MRIRLLAFFLLFTLVFSFVVVQPAYANPDVAITTNSYGAETGSQRRLIQTSNGNLLKFWSDATNMRWNVSADDGATWINGGTVRAATLSRQFALWYDPDYNVSRIWYVYTKNGVSSKWYTARGILNSSQTGISWGTEYSYGSSSASIAYWYGTIICLLNGSLQAFVTTVASGLSRLYLWRATSNTGSNFVQYSTQVAAYAADTTPWENSAVPLSTSTRSYVIAHQDTTNKKLVGRRWNGTGFDGQICVSYFGGANRSQTGQNGISLSNDGDICYAVWQSHQKINTTYSEVILHAIINANNTLGPLTQISNDSQAVSEHGPTISVDATHDVQTVIWGYSDDLYYRVYRASTWETIETYNPGYTQVIEYTVNSPWHLPVENEVPMTYQQGLNPPFTLYFKMFDITPGGAVDLTFTQSETFTISDSKAHLIETTAIKSEAFVLSDFSRWMIEQTFIGQDTVLVSASVWYGSEHQFTVSAIFNFSDASVYSIEILLQPSETFGAGSAWKWLIEQTFGNVATFGVESSSWSSYEYAFTFIVSEAFGFASTVSYLIEIVVRLPETFSFGSTSIFTVESAAESMWFGIVLFMFALAGGSMLFVLLYADSKASREQISQEPAYQT